MKNLFLILFVFSAFVCDAQIRHWQDIDESAISGEVMTSRTLIPNKVRSLKFDYLDLKASLREAPMEIKGKAIDSDLLISIPYPDGRDIVYKLVESPNMMPGISARYPSIKSYRGVGIEDAHRSIRLVISQLGIHGVCSGPEGQVYLDPYAMGNLEYVQSYFVSDYTPLDHPALSLSCGTTGKDLDSDWVAEGNHDVATITAAARDGEVVVERIYRMAIAATGEWTTQLYNGSVQDGLAAMNVSMSRINSIWERDISIRGILIDQEDQLIQTSTATDPYTMANQGGVLLGQNTAVLNEIIGLQAYDFGHVYTANCSDVGGIASLGSVCGPGRGAGVTCHYSSNLDFVTVSIACHEMGHQLSANHTFNNCGNNIAPATAYEPGSGSTIMSYCGLCGNQNIQPQADDLYHVSSLDEIYDFTHAGNGAYCGMEVTSDNIRPTVTFPYADDFYVPIETPLLLKAVGVDDNGDALKYNFEQFTLGPVSDLGTPLLDAPAFRSLYPGDDDFRYLPKQESVVNNVSNDIREVLPSISRDMTFRVTARDYNEVIGASNWDEVEFRATDEAGPFLVEAPNTATTIEAGSSYEVLWDVANTDGELVDCQSVNIYIASDGGYTFDKLLAENVPNDGSHTVVIPDLLTSTARIKVEAVDNIFYDISNMNFSIEAPSAPSYNFSSSPYAQQACLPSTNEISISTIAVLDYNSPITMEAVGAPAGAVVTFSANPVMPGEDVTATFDFSNIDLTEELEIIIQGVSQSMDTVSHEVVFDIYSNNFASIALTAPAANEEGVVEVPDFEWLPSVNADTYVIEIADNPSFEETSILERVSGITGTTFSPSILLPKNIPLYWRIAPVNICGQGAFTATEVFHTETLGCYEESQYGLNIIVPTSPAVREHSITFFDDGTINDLNISNINIDYSPVVSLILTLTGPDGTSIILMDSQCGGTSQVDLGYDDQAPGALPCPANTGVRYKPIEPLSIFNGKNVKGEWTLKIETTISGFNSGKFNGWALEVCSNISQAGPELVNNNTLFVKTNDAQVIEPSHLLAEDQNNTSAELVYTLIDGLHEGDLYLNETLMAIGDQYNQAEINSYRITYRHNGGNVAEDFFNFNISDGEGGFIGKTKFLVDIDDDNLPLSTDAAEVKTFNLFPNPASDIVTIEFIEAVGQDELLELYDVKGVQVLSRKLVSGTNKIDIPLNGLAPGFYLVRRLNAEGVFGADKLILQR